jgi:hypothetical protein
MSSSSSEMMDIVERLDKEAGREERRILKLMDVDMGSGSKTDSSGRSLGSEVSSSSSQGDKEIKKQQKIINAFQHYADKTALRAVLYLRELADPQTVLLKAYVQSLLHHRTEDPNAFLDRIQNLKLPKEAFFHFTEKDKLGFYIYAHFYLFTLYRSHLTVREGYEQAYWNNMANEILNALAGEPLLVRFVKFMNQNQEVLGTIGFESADLYDQIKLKFGRELFHLYNLFIGLPVRTNIGSPVSRKVTEHSHTFVDAFIQVRHYLSSAHPTFVQHVDSYLAPLEKQVRDCCVPQAGGAKRRVIKNVFHFTRFTKVGPRRRTFSN